MIPAEDDLRPVVVSTDTPDRFAAWRALERMGPDTLACVEPVPGLNLVCLRVWEGPTRRWVLASDVTSWGVDASTLVRRAAARAPAHVAAAELVPIEGMSASYLRLQDRDGWAAVGVLRPDLLADRLGGVPFRVAIPNEGVMLAWRVQGDEVDRVMAVGAREWFDRAPAPVSPRIVSWDGQGWLPFGEAVPKAGPP